MRARLTYLVLSPRTPRWIAHRTTEGLTLAAAVAGLVAIVTGAASHVLFAGIVAGAHLVGAA